MCVCVGGIMSVRCGFEREGVCVCERERKRERVSEREKRDIFSQGNC